MVSCHFTPIVRDFVFFFFGARFLPGVATAQKYKKKRLAYSALTAGLTYISQIMLVSLSSKENISINALKFKLNNSCSGHYVSF